MRRESNAQPSLKIDVVSDIVCPWCFIGKRKLEAALAELDKSEPALDIEIRWHPFQLNPDLPADGISRASYVEQKFGGAARAAQIYARVTSAGEAVGIPFRFDRIERQPNTLDGHRLVAWAQRQRDATPLVERLFSAFFLEGTRVDDRGELARVAAESGWSRHEALAMLESRAMHEEIENESREALDVGIQGVPFFIFNGSIAVSGAQDPARLLEAVAAARRAPDA
ncbi:MAG TPA: DsbA family oxidoreductase [Casimicrobiaceae bacterium]|nr:DsbA family oxidoreductase [Casimicrobiaceae bacterium]